RTRTNALPRGTDRAAERNSTRSVLAGRARFRDAPIRLGENAMRRDRRDRRAQLVAPARHDLGLTVHHRFEARTRDFSRIVLLAAPDTRVEHVGPRKEVRVRRAG